ncbi:MULTISPECIES: Kazal-type serine protease inhibitor family protein [Streptomyces]|uniref:Kazal-type serine protease inhibitor family protein n=1 Tax=Streptomyces cremeus TaxID=66881 RepID=A0ABV5PNR9_STRCM
MTRRLHLAAAAGALAFAAFLPATAAAAVPASAAPQTVPVAAASAGEPRYCPSVYDPVCGENGVTYTNKCWAAREGVRVKHHGVCHGDL